MRKGKKREPQLQTSLHNLDPWEGDGANPFESHKQMKDRNIIRSRQHWFTKKSFFTFLISCDNLSVDRRAAEVYLKFSRVFNTVSQNNLIDKLMKSGLDKWAMKWVEKWLNWHDKCCRTKSSRNTVANGLPQGFTLVSISFNNFINDTDDGTECTLCRFAGDAKWRGLKYQMGMLLFRETLKGQWMGPQEHFGVWKPTLQKRSWVLCYPGLN